MHMKWEMAVVVCAYTEDRWNDLVATLESVQRQTLPAQEIILVVDHNPGLFQRALQQLSDVRVIQNLGERGLSGARNTGIQAVNAEIIVFIDDDAIASPTWLEVLSKNYRAPSVMGVGGSIVPDWTSARPKWFPEEFYWVVGCTYRGMPEERKPIRNLIGCNMSFRREVFLTIGNFREGVGRIDTLPFGCEETELCIRARQEWPDKDFIYEPVATVLHRVPEQRMRFSYFISRCYSEGISKARVTDFVGSKDGLSSERSYVLRTLSSGVWNNIRTSFSRREPTILLRAGSILVGLTITSLGYLIGKAFTPKKAEEAKVPKTSSRTIVREKTEFSPIKILPIEISDTIPSVPVFEESNPRSYRNIQALIRLHNQPLGIIELDVSSSRITDSELSKQIRFSFGNQIREHLLQDGISESEFFEGQDPQNLSTQHCQLNHSLKPNEEPYITILVATRDRPDSLAKSLRTILELKYSNFDVVVIDNAPSSNAARDFIHKTYHQHSKIRYVREDSPGLAIAHNRAFAEITAPFVAFTDDDVLVDPYWLQAIIHNFLLDDEVGCVTGLIMPIELETISQLWVEQFGGFGKGFTKNTFDLNKHRPQDLLFPYTAGKFGSGANMAFRTSALRTIGGFDPALGAGTLSRGGDDLAAFFEIINHGFKIIYEPAALVFHHHRRDYPSLHKQAYGYGVGLGAFLMKTLVEKPTRIVELALKSPFGLSHFLKRQPSQKRDRENDYPRELRFLQLRGLVYGPVAYLRSYFRTRQQREKLSGFQKLWNLDSKNP